MRKQIPGTWMKRELRGMTISIEIQNEKGELKRSVFDILRTILETLLALATDGCTPMTS
jgi:hypothetical protein